MRVVVTGVAGFLGSHLAEKFLAEGHDVVGIDNLLGGYLENVPDGVEFYNRDLAGDLDSIQDLFEGANLVVHAACTAYEGLSVFSPSLVTANTVQASVNAVTASIWAGVDRFVYMSSMARYGDYHGAEYFEAMTPKPQDPYGIGKLAAEQLVRNLCTVHGVNWVILVPHNIIGPRQKYDDPYRNVASIMANRMLQGKQPIIYGDGSQKRCFSFISDVIEPLYTACFSDDAVGEIINIGPDEEPVTILELAEMIAGILEFDLDPIFMPGRPQEVPIALCSSDKARKILGYQTGMAFEDGVRELVEWIDAKGAKEFSYHLPVEIESPLAPKTWTQRLM